jgi:hypothetical protein
MTFLVYTILNRTKNAGPPCRTNEQKKFLISGTYIRAFLSVSMMCVLKVMASKREKRGSHILANCHSQRKMRLHRKSAGWTWGVPELHYLRFVPFWWIDNRFKRKVESLATSYDRTLSFKTENVLSILRRRGCLKTKTSCGPYLFSHLVHIPHETIPLGWSVRIMYKT